MNLNITSEMKKKTILINNIWYFALGFSIGIIISSLLAIYISHPQ